MRSVRGHKVTAGLSGQPKAQSRIATGWRAKQSAALTIVKVRRWFTATALLTGWAIGFFGGSYLAWIDGLKPLHPVTFGETTFTVFVGMIAFAANVVARPW
jgi:SSS family solute:Na+ symporter